MSVDCLSLRLSTWNNSAPTGLIIMKSDIWVFFENLSRKFKLHQHRGRKTAVYMKYNVFLIIPRSVLLRMKNVSHKGFREYQDAHFTFNNFFFRKSYRVWDTWKNIVLPGRTQTPIQHRKNALDAVYLRLRRHSQNMYLLLLFHCNNGCKNTPHWYVIRTLSVLFFPVRVL